MMVSKISIIFIGFMAILIAGCVGSPQENGATTGRAVFTIADKAADMGNVSSIKVTVDSISAHSTNQSWVNVSSTSKTYDLLQLKASGYQALLADVQLQNGMYEQVRLHISKVVVTDANGDHEATLPSGELKVVSVFEVQGNTTSVVSFDFEADKSLHVTGNGEYILAPVVRVQARNKANVQVKNENNVQVSGGNAQTDMEVGMDENGSVGAGSRISSNAAVSIQNGVIVVSPPGLGNTTGKQPDTHGNQTGNKGSANYQQCESQCTPGNAGSGEFCTDNCRAEEGARTQNTYWCDQLDNTPNIPSCYGTVAKTTGNLSLCNRFSGTEKDHCVAAFGSTSAG
jgi:hypothetical protein